VIGGTRGTGKLIAQILDQKGYEVYVLARNPLRARKGLKEAIQIIEGDITIKESLPPAMTGVAHVIFTAGCRSGRPFREAQIKETEYHGLLNTLAAAKRTGFTGRFLYMTSSGVTSSSFWTFCLNLYKGNTLKWRHRAEGEIRASGLDYTIIRAGVLLNGSGGKRPVRITEDALPLSPRFRIDRVDVANVFVEVLASERARRTSFEVAWDRRGELLPFSESLRRLIPD